MTNLYKILAIVSVFALLAWWFFSQGKKTEVIKQQEQQIEIQNEIIQTNKKVFQRKAIARNVSVNDDLEWMREHRCEDCKS